MAEPTPVHLANPHGPVAWMVKNRVTPNLLMLVLLLGGLFLALQIKQEVFPDFEFDIAAWILAVLGLGLIGGLAWKLRPVLAKRRESRLRRDGHPRGRALPPPPPPGDEDEEDW